MTINKIKKYSLIFFLTVACMHCTQKTDKTNSQREKLDIFRENGIPKGVVVNTNINADSALKRSTMAGTITHLKLLDSTIKKELYLYSALIKNIEKGRKQKPKAKIYFITYDKLVVVKDSSNYNFYFIAVIEHRIIKNNLAVQWQWCPGAPLIPLLESNNPLSNPANKKMSSTN